MPTRHIDEAFYAYHSGTGLCVKVHLKKRIDLDRDEFGQVIALEHAVSLETESGQKVEVDPNDQTRFFVVTPRGPIEIHSFFPIKVPDPCEEDSSPTSERARDELSQRIKEEESHAAD